MTTPTAEPLNTGRMPNTIGTYADFEGLLARIYVGLKPLEDSPDHRDNSVYQQSMDILDEFAERHRVRKPEDAVNTPRASIWLENQPVSVWSLNEQIHEIWTGFKVGGEPDSHDWAERSSLNLLWGQVVDRYGFAETERTGTSVIFDSWDQIYFHRSLADVID
tara:strand:+ start:40316 stop:40804 length:489 start_codon:yes stop_codon:yes gene_type:complete